MKPKFMATIVALATALCFLQPLKAQDFFVKHYDSILQPIDKTPITSNILIDRVGPINQIVGFNNNTDTTNYENTMQAYLELYNANYRNTRMTEPSKLMYNIELQNLQNRVPIQVLDYAYQQIKPSALQDGLLVNNNGTIYNAAGSPNPFLNKRIQLTTLLVDKIKTTNFKFYVAPHFISRNTGVTVSSINIVGNGINISMNGVWDSAAVSLPSYGDFYFNITTTLSDGTTYLTKNMISVGENSNNAGMRTTQFEAQPACNSTNFIGNIPWQGYDETQAYTGMFDLDIYYRAGVSCANGVQPLKSPVILIDGFDPTDKRNTKNKVLYSKFLKYVDDVNNPNYPDTVDFVRQIRELGKDVILVDIPTYFHLYNSNVQIHLDSNATPPPPGYSLTDGWIIRGGGNYVERNAMTMVALLIDIQNQMAAAGSTDSIILIGPSMGGQITRYALKYMEDRGIQHRVKLWISQDSNHEGATVPIGEQLTIATLANVNAKTMISRDRQLLCPANKQFIIDHWLHHIDNMTNLNIINQDAGGAPNFHNRYLNTIDSIGWPQLCRKISIISGAENGGAINAPSAEQQAMNIVGRLTSLSFPDNFWVNFLGIAAYQDIKAGIEKSKVFEVKMYTAPKPNELGLVAKIYLKKDKTTGAELIKNFYTKGPTQTRNQSLETVQSGFYHGYSELASFIDPVTSDTVNHNPTAIGIIKYKTTVYAHQHSFQPTGSTLAYGKGSNPNLFNSPLKWDDDVTMFNLSCDKYIPFDYYMGPSTFSVLHDSIFYPQALVIIDEIQGIKHEREKPTQMLFLQKDDPTKNYFCPNEIQYFSAHYYLTNSVLTPTWVLSNNTYFQIVSGQGTATVGIKYLGGMSYDESLNPVSLTITGEGQCYKYIPGGQTLYLGGTGDTWGGTLSFVSGSNPNMPYNYSFGGIDLNYLPLSNYSDRYRVKIGGGLVHKENNLQQYSLLQNTNGTAMTWGVYPYTNHGYTQNYVNILSNPGGEYLYQITDANRCAASQINTFSINFSSRNLIWRVATNPIKNELVIEKVLTDENELDKISNVSFTIVNIHSKQVLLTKKLLNSTNFKIPVNGLINGEYAVIINYGGEETTLKFWVRN
jgi:hypothetical protein